MWLISSAAQHFFIFFFPDPAAQEIKEIRLDQPEKEIKK
jgi:hypothetical protein